MTPEIFQFVLPLTTLIVVVVAFLVYLLVKVPKSYWIKWLGVPVVLLASFFSYNIYTTKLGQPLPTTFPEQEFVLLGGRIIAKESIELWIRESYKTSRLIRIPYDEKTAKELQRALERSGKGVTQMGRGKRKGDRGDSESTESVFYDYPHAREIPKTDSK